MFVVFLYKTHGKLEMGPHIGLYDTRKIYNSHITVIKCIDIDCEKI